MSPSSSSADFASCMANGAGETEGDFGLPECSFSQRGQCPQSRLSPQRAVRVKAHQERRADDFRMRTSLGWFYRVDKAQKQNDLQPFHSQPSLKANTFNRILLPALLRRPCHSTPLCKFSFCISRILQIPSSGNVGKGKGRCTFWCGGATQIIYSKWEKEQRTGPGRRKTILSRVKLLKVFPSFLGAYLKQLVLGLVSIKSIIMIKRNHK